MLRSAGQSCSITDPGSNVARPSSNHVLAPLPCGYIWEEGWLRIKPYIYSLRQSNWLLVAFWQHLQPNRLHMTCISLEFVSATERVTLSSRQHKVFIHSCSGLRPGEATRRDHNTVEGHNIRRPMDKNASKWNPNFFIITLLLNREEWSCKVLKSHTFWCLLIWKNFCDFEFQIY